MSGLTAHVKYHVLCNFLGLHDGICGYDQTANEVYYRCTRCDKRYYLSDD